MITLSRETEVLAERLAAARRVSVDEAVRQALEASARAAGVSPEQRRRRMTVEQMQALGAEIAALPILDPRSPQEIMDDINEL
ncbi:type II toxin-antitoxin system VapB family antitoxin [Methylocystis sp. SB2]|uniref:type II toxin-antitoxin system VapB family antitoxin n=1 Tax=Methylocystis sp. (strain SB2) TaxID=743836 RepID=UPI0004A2FB4E|nr:type II toxin-antitoxin system VapB family antitoxin [Methylocystis sp. SB2]ULO23519.1 type II toxin-antitoxin system VapB family antitoxin [Methylocystis sp. SB2]